MNGWGRFGLAAAADLGLDEADLPVRTDARGSIAWDSVFPLAELALDSVALASAVIDRAGRARGRPDTAAVSVDPRRVAASFGSDRMLRIDGDAPSVWAPLSGFFAVADGWVRTHGNYPAHAARLRSLMGLDAESDADDLRAALAGRGRFELEEAAARAGAIIAAVRDAREWAEHPQAAPSSTGPLVDARTDGDAPPRPWQGDGRLPLSGVRVLDLTRVIAGPVATRDLALAGADVLRVDDPRLPEISWQHLDTGQHKRTTLLDLTNRADRAAFDELLATADAVVMGYRAGALDRFGLDPETLAETHPGIVVGSVSAWGTRGPWAERRGFDSIVQATIGIARAEQERAGSDRPGALPVQALDHSSGHLLATAVAHSLARQRRDGGSHRVSVSLARTGAEVMRHRGEHQPAEATEAVATAASASASVRLDDGTVLACAPPALAFEGAPSEYSFVHRWGTDAARWSTRDPAA